MTSERVTNINEPHAWQHKAPQSRRLILLLGADGGQNKGHRARRADDIPVQAEMAPRLY